MYEKILQNKIEIHLFADCYINLHSVIMTKAIETNCRYGRVEEDPKKSRLFLICNPVSRVGKQVAYLQLWDPAQGRFSRTAQSEESLSALAVRDDGRFVAVGTMFTGTVDVYIAFSLQVIFSFMTCDVCSWS